MEDSLRTDSFEPGDYLKVLRRRWWIVLGLTIIGLAGAFAYVKVAPKSYTATTSVSVTATSGANTAVAGSRTGGSVNMDSEAQLVQSVTVATIAAKDLNTSVPPTTLVKDVSVTVPPNSNVLQIACDQPSGTAAAACAQAFAHAYLKNRADTVASQLNGTLKTLQSQVTTLTRADTSLNTKIATLPPNSTQRASAQGQLTSNQSQLRSLSSQIGTIEGQLANTSGGAIITSAAAPSTPSSPQKKLVLPSGLVIGLLLGLIIAFWVDSRDKRVRGPRDLERYLDLPVMLNVAVKQRNPQPMLVNPRSRPGQGFAELAHAAGATLGEGSHVLLVAAASPGTGGSFTAANLAVALARMRSDVMLVCADLRGSVTPELFGLSRDRGLTDVLNGGASVFDVAQRPAESGRLRVITPGTDTSIDLYTFAEDVPRRLVADLRASSSIIVIEAQASGPGSDTFALAELADAALVVAETGHSTRPELAETLERLDRLRTPVLGGVVIPHFGNLPKSRVPARPAVPARRRG